MSDDYSSIPVINVETRLPDEPAVHLQEDLRSEDDAELFGGAVFKSGRGTVGHSIEMVDSAEMRVARLNPAPLPPLLSSDGVTRDRGFLLASERAALLAYLRKI